MHERAVLIPPDPAIPRNSAAAVALEQLWLHWPGAQQRPVVHRPDRRPDRRSFPRADLGGGRWHLAHGLWLDLGAGMILFFWGALAMACAVIGLFFFKF